MSCYNCEYYEEDGLCNSPNDEEKHKVLYPSSECKDFKLKEGLRK